MMRKRLRLKVIFVLFYLMENKYIILNDIHSELFNDN